MAFLSEDREPENILEQMIWNNRRAWEFMIANLYRPVNEESIRSLAYMLTEGMDHCAKDYRRQDTHPIAAMQGEPYEVPHAARIPELMEEYYRFMNDPQVHPLIKASVGAAYLLVARPFPEGNERLSRMISSWVLFRSGYGFFREVSLSSVIAKETWLYYQNLCEILRSENDGDLTYFLEYFLEMLVRAMDQKKEQEKTRTESLILQEQQMAVQSLTPTNGIETQPSEPGTE